MSVYRLFFTRIIFDKTAIESTSYNYLRYGPVLGSMFNSTINIVALDYYSTLGFLIGLSSFSYEPLSIIQFSCQVNTSAIFSISTQPFRYLKFNYFSIRYPSCIAAYPYFDPATLMCFDECLPVVYLNANNLTQCTCHYSCEKCQNSTTTCTSCSALSNRVLNGTSCVPMPGFYDNGT